MYDERFNLNHLCKSQILYIGNQELLKLSVSHINIIHIYMPYIHQSTIFIILKYISAEFVSLFTNIVAYFMHTTLSLKVFK